MSYRSALRGHKPPLHATDVRHSSQPIAESRRSSLQSVTELSATIGAGVGSDRPPMESVVHSTLAPVDAPPPNPAYDMTFADSQFSAAARSGRSPRSAIILYGENGECLKPTFWSSDTKLAVNILEKANWRDVESSPDPDDDDMVADTYPDGERQPSGADNTGRRKTFDSPPGSMSKSDVIPCLEELYPCETDNHAVGAAFSLVSFGKREGAKLAKALAGVIEKAKEDARKEAKKKSHCPYRCSTIEPQDKIHWLRFMVLVTSRVEGVYSGHAIAFAQATFRCHGTATVTPNKGPDSEAPRDKRRGTSTGTSTGSASDRGLAHWDDVAAARPWERD